MSFEGVLSKGYNQFFDFKCPIQKNILLKQLIFNFVIYKLNSFKIKHFYMESLKKNSTAKKGYNMELEP